MTDLSGEKPSLAAEAPGAVDRPLAVLVTGPGTAIGRALVRYLYYDPAIRYIWAIGLEPRPYFFDQYDPGRFRYSRVDITRLRELKNLFYSSEFKDIEFDAVCHLAIRNRPDEKRPEMAHKLNVQGTRNILDFSLEAPTIREFIFRSSHAVYRADPMNPVFLDEQADLNFAPDADRWVRDRVDAELLCRAKMDDPRLKIVVLRFSNLVGRGVHQYMNAYINSPVPLRPAGFNPMVNLLHVRDAVRAIELALARQDVAGVFNIVGKETGPLSEICRLNGHPARSVPAGLMLRALYRIQRRLRMTDFYYEADPNRLIYPILMDGRRAKDVLGYEPQTHVELG